MDRESLDCDCLQTIGSSRCLQGFHVCGMMEAEGVVTKGGRVEVLALARVTTSKGC